MVQPGSMGGRAMGNGSPFVLLVFLKVSARGESFLSVSGHCHLHRCWAVRRHLGNRVDSAVEEEWTDCPRGPLGQMGGRVLTEASLLQEAD